jgi:hypothetical protein
MHNWSTFGAWTNQGHTRTHKIHHIPNLGEATTLPLIVLFFISHRGYIQMSFCPMTPKLGVTKFPKLGLSWLWKLITSYADIRLKWGLKQSCCPRWEIFNNMWHATCTQVNQGDSRLLVGENQIGTLTPNLFLNHNLCFNYSNGSCKLISDI